MRLTAGRATERTLTGGHQFIEMFGDATGTPAKGVFASPTLNQTELDI